MTDRFVQENTGPARAEHDLHRARWRINSPKLKDRLTDQGLVVYGSSPEEMLALMRADTRKWSEVITATGVKIPQ